MITDYQNRQLHVTLHEASVETGIRYIKLQRLSKDGTLERVPTTGQEVVITRASLAKYIESQKAAE